MPRNSFRLSVAGAAIACLLLGLAPAVARGAGPGVHGRVLGHDEKGTFLGIVAGAKIEFQSRAGAKVAQVAADKDGYYKVNLPPGEYLYKIEAPGYRKEDAGRGMRLEQYQGYAIFNLALTKGQTEPNHKTPEVPPQKIGKLHGRVLEKAPRGTLGISNARLALRREGSRELVTVYSRGDAADKGQAGNYEVTLEVGVYHASVSHTGFEQFVDPQPIEIQVGKEATRDFVLSREKPPESAGQGIRGMVTVIDSNETPPPIKLQIVPSGAAGTNPINVQIATNGAFTHDLPPGRYRVTASATGFPTAASPPEFVLAGKYTVVNLALRAQRVPEPKTSLDVFVFTKVDGRDQPLAGARVSLLKSGASPLAARSAATDGTGHAVFPVTEAGEYLAEAHLPGYSVGSKKGTVQLGHHHEVGFELIKESASPTEFSLAVLVSDALSKKPLAGANVLARHEQQTLAEAVRGTTDATGAVTLRVTRAGNYTVLAQLSGFEPGGTKTDISVQQPNRATVGLKALATPTGPTDDQKPISLTVTGFVAHRENSRQLSAISGAKLVWERIVPKQPPLLRFVTTSTSGRFEIALLAGSYQVRIEPPAGFEGALEQVEISPTTSEQHFIIRRVKDRLPPSADLMPVKGAVVQEASAGRFAGIAGAEVLFLRAEGAETAQSGTGGSFGLQLAQGTYRVHVRARGYEPLDTRAEVRAEMMPLQFVLKAVDQPAAGFTLTLNVVERSRSAIAALMRPVPGAEVQIAHSGSAVLSGVTNSAGQYSVRVKPGNYSARVSKAGYEGGSAELSIVDQDMTRQLVVTRGGGAEPSDETKKSALKVRVARRTQQPSTAIALVGTPLPGAQVTILRGANAVASGTTNRGGAFSADLPTGTYSVKVVAQGYAPAEKVAKLAGLEAIVDFQLGQIDSSANSPTIEPGGETRRVFSPGGEERRTAQLSPTVASPYLVEYRLNKQLPWTVIGRYTSREEAQRALLQAVERGRIPSTAETHVKISEK